MVLGRPQCSLLVGHEEFESVGGCGVGRVGVWLLTAFEPFLLEKKKLGSLCQKQKPSKALVWCRSQGLRAGILRAIVILRPRIPELDLQTYQKQSQEKLQYYRKTLLSTRHVFTV